MIIELLPNGEIIKIEKRKDDEIFWIKDEAKDISKHTLNNTELTSIKIEKEKLKYIILPACFRGEIYYTVQNERTILSNDFYYIASKLGLVSIDSNSKEYFLNKGYCPKGCTLIKEIHRLYNNSTYYFLKGEFETKKDQDDKQTFIVDDKIKYARFKCLLNEVIDSNISSNVGLLLSGGADSRLLLLLLIEKVRNLQIITNKCNPFFFENCTDMYIAQEVGKLVGKKVYVSEVDYKEIDISQLNKVIREMPCSAHGSFNFINMFKDLYKLGNVDRVFSGQNMDTLYNLGPTERTSVSIHGAAQWFKRFYLSEYFAKSLKDVEGCITPIDSLIANIGCSIYKVITKQRGVTLPHNSLEYISNFEKSNDYTVFSKKDINLISEGKDITPLEIKRRLFDVKINYLKGGDAQIISCCGKMYGMKVILPYSDSKMIDYFRDLSLSRKDIWFPKRYVYQYIKEYIPKYGKKIADFSKPHKNILNNKYGNIDNLYNTYEQIICNTKLGKQLQNMSIVKASGYTGLMKYNSLIYGYWFSEVMRILQEDYGVIIK